MRRDTTNFFTVVLHQRYERYFPQQLKKRYLYCYPIEKQKHWYFSRSHCVSLCVQYNSMYRHFKINRGIIWLRNQHKKMMSHIYCMNKPNILYCLNKTNWSKVIKRNATDIFLSFQFSKKIIKLNWIHTWQLFPNKLFIWWADYNGQDIAY